MKVRQRDPTVCRNDTNSLSNMQLCCRYWGAHTPTVWLVDAYTNWCLTVPPGSTFSVWVLPVGIKPAAPSVVPYCIKPSRIAAVCIMLIRLDFSSYITQIKHVTLQYRFETLLTARVSLSWPLISEMPLIENAQLLYTVEGWGKKQLLMAAKSFFSKWERQKWLTCS